MSVLPVISGDSAPLWGGYRECEIRIPWCEVCGRPHLPPGPVCPYCLSDRLAWRKASGRGVVSTIVVMRRRYFEDFEPPYPIVQVELEEGPRLTAGAVMDDFTRLHVGAPVVAEFETSANGMILPRFRPAG